MAAVTTVIIVLILLPFLQNQGSTVTRRNTSLLRTDFRYYQGEAGRKEESSCHGEWAGGREVAGLRQVGIRSQTQGVVRREEG